MRTVTHPSVNPSKRDACDEWTHSLGCSDLGTGVLAFADLPWGHEYRNIRVIVKSAIPTTPFIGS
jgi:hypothetical protein